MRPGIIWRFIGVVAIVVVCALAIWKLPINLGLDLRGGTRMILEARDTETIKADDDAVSRAKEVIERRVNQLGVAEPVIYRQGARRIIVELAGVKDPHRAREIIGRTAQLEFRDERGNIIMTGNDLKTAVAGYDQYSRPAVNFELTGEGARKFEKATLDNIGRRIAIYLDEELLSAPVVQTVIKDKGQITGLGSMDRAKDLSMMLRAGALPVPLEVLHAEVLEPTLALHAELTKARTVAFTCLVMAQLIYVFHCRSEYRRLSETDILTNPYLIGAVIVSGAMQLAAVYLPVAQGVFRTVALDGLDWIIVFVLSGWSSVFTVIVQKIRGLVLRRTSIIRA
jgi:preprotein translocase subunit SecD